MDGIHDMGGKEGFGPISADPDEKILAHEWERRVLGIFFALSAPDDWTGDWFRYCRELLPPEDYLARPYYDQWLQSLTAMLLNSGVVTLEELADGSSSRELGEWPRPHSAEDVLRLKSRSERFDREAAMSPRFREGDRVRVRLLSTPGHTRLPQYARGQLGRVARCQGCHVLPDENAFGRVVAEPLYLVSLRPSSIWKDAEDSDASVFLDLWESYLESP